MVKIKLRILFLFLSVTSLLNAQELIQTEYEKGYIKDGKKYSVWQYFNANKEVELAINHTTGKVMYIIPDTSYYVIFRNGKWVASKLDLHPVPVTGYYNFYGAVSNTVVYTSKDYKNGLEGNGILLFDVDTMGIASNYQIVKGICKSCDSTILKSLNSINPSWTPAVVNKRRYLARFALGFEFRIKENQFSFKSEVFKGDTLHARILRSFVINEVLKYMREDYEDKLYTVVEKTAEPIGGMEQFYRFIGKNLKYPADERKLGIEGKVFMKFIIEKDGSLTNIEVAKTSSLNLANEAVRVISLIPKWSPGEQSGRKVRQAYTLPINFKLK